MNKEVKKHHQKIMRLGPSPKRKKQDLIRIKDFFEKNPTLWEVCWAFLWRTLILFLGVYFYIAILIYLFKVLTFNLIYLMLLSI